LGECGNGPEGYSLLNCAEQGGCSSTLRQELNLFDGISIVVGTIIGSGIFLIPSFIAAQLKSLGAVLIVWIVGGLLTLCGALSLAELGSVYTGSGGLCGYLEEAYGRLTAFLYAWALLLIIHSGSIAALAAAFGMYLGKIVPVSSVGEKLLAAAAILTLTMVSCLGIRAGKLVQNFIVAAKIGGLGAIIVFLNLRGSRSIRLFDNISNEGHQLFSLAGFGIALIAVLWAYEAWHVISFVAGEMKSPQRDLPRSLLYGSATVVLIFIVANLGYYRVLSPAEIQGSNAVAALAMERLVGPRATIVISFLILVSILGSMNGMILTGPRVYYSMARHGLFPHILGHVNVRWRTPALALMVQGCWASILVSTGTYEQLFTDVIFTAWIFYGLAVAGVLVLRHIRPQLKRPFRMPGYPWLCLLFCLAAAGLVFCTIIERPRQALTGFGLVSTGIPVYLLRSARQSR
jgi:basic amino acid/polyamine antiporter, APA family